MLYNFNLQSFLQFSNLYHVHFVSSNLICCKFELNRDFKTQKKFDG